MLGISSRFMASAKRVALGLWIAMAGCGRLQRIERPPADELPGMNPGEHALFQPRGAPEQLLGLPVTEGSDGQFVVGSARNPGCEVVSRPVPAQWNRHFTEQIGRAAVFEVGRSDVASLQAKYGKTVRVESQVSNVERLEADLRGSCGDAVIKVVYVGTGWREVQYNREQAGKAGANIEGAPLAVGGSGWERIGSRLEWSLAQAWAFEIGEGSEEGADLLVHMPAEITSGTEFIPVIDVRRTVWLVVIYRDAEGNHGVVLPTPEIPAYRADAGSRVPLPKLQASTLPGHDADHETLLVFGFVEEGDFKAFRPPPGALTVEQANTYARSLEARLQDVTQIPRARWTATTFGYRVTSATGATGE